MALHRDILWIGRQWAVTGHGMQLIDQRLEGAFDIELARLWDDDVIAQMRARQWLNAEDFDKGLSIARTRHTRPEPGSVPVAAPAPAIAPPEPPPPSPERPAAVEPPQTAPPPPVAVSLPPPVESAKEAAPDLQMKTEGRARFARPWRVWVKKT